MQAISDGIARRAGGAALTTVRQRAGAMGVRAKPRAPPWRLRHGGCGDEWSRRNRHYTMSSRFSMEMLQEPLALLSEFVYPPPRSMMMHNEDIRFPLTTAAHATVASPCSFELRGDRNVPGYGHALAERRMR
jgi:hypothetical protein